MKIIYTLALAFTGLPMRAQTPPPPAASAALQTSVGQSVSVPTFRNRAEVVLVPVVVRDKHGKAVTGLTKAAFTVEENGKKQEISSIEELTDPKAVAEKQSATDIINGFSNLPLDVFQHPHVTIVVLDLINTNEIQRTDGKERLNRFFSRDLPVGEPVSLLCLTRKGVQSLHTFTSDASELIAALKHLKVEGATLGAPRNLIEHTMKQLREIARAYAGVPGRKTLIWASGDIPSPDMPLTPFGDSRDEVAIDFQSTWKELLSANIAVYPFGLLISADSIFSTSRDSAYHEKGLRSFAIATGGALCEEANALSACLNHAIEDSRRYYLLSYVLQQGDRTTGWRTLKVKVNVPNAEIRARDGFFYEEAAGPSPSRAQSEEVAALASPLPVSGILMNVRALPSDPVRIPGGKVVARFLITIPLGGVTVDPAHSPALDLEVGAIALDSKVKDAGEFLHPVRGNLSPDKIKELSSNGIRLQEKLELIPGTYDMRFVVRDNPSGKIGTVVFPLEVK